MGVARRAGVGVSAPLTAVLDDRQDTPASGPRWLAFRILRGAENVGCVRVPEGYGAPEALARWLGEIPVKAARDRAWTAEIARNERAVLAEEERHHKRMSALKAQHEARLNGIRQEADAALSAVLDANCPRKRP